MKKILILITILSTSLIIGFNVNNVNAQTTVVVDIETYYNGDLLTSSQRTVNQGETLVYEVGDFLMVILCIGLLMMFLGTIYNKYNNYK